MNFTEGMRRLALLLGAIGFLAGGFFSYLELQELQNQNARHNRFAVLADSEGVKKLRKEHQESKDPYEVYVTSVMPGCCDIKEIYWDKDHVFNDASGIYSIETNGGQTLFPTPAPSRWLYVFIVLCPIFGFFIPWVSIRAIGWVGAGFIQ